MWSVFNVFIGLIGLSSLLSRVDCQNNETFGSLSNFDCYCVTGQDCHGFEIELEQITCADVVYTFDWNRYGAPEKEDTGTSCIVRYRATYDLSTQQYSATTLIPVDLRPGGSGKVQPTGGHSCFLSGMGTQMAYDDSGCEHYGVSLGGASAPTATLYRWLIADPANVGGLRRADTLVGVPAVAWTVNPPPAGGNGAGPMVQAAIKVEDFGDEVKPCEMFGDAKWVKVFVTEIENEVRLEELIVNNPVIPQNAGETEIEWQLLQRLPTCGSDAQNPEANEFNLGKEKDAGNRSIIRRYEFYEYTGLFDAENNEAMPDSDSNPLDFEIGNYLGSQMAALVFDPAFPPPPEVLAIQTKSVAKAAVHYYYSKQLIATGGVHPYTWTLTGGTILPPGLELLQDGRIVGLPSKTGSTKFRVRVTDSLGMKTSKMLEMVVKALVVRTRQLPYAYLYSEYYTVLEAEGGSEMRTWSLVGTSKLPKGLALSTFGEISGVPKKSGVWVFQVRVKDNLGRHDIKELRINVMVPS